jgi:RNA-directed DNA polymerase
VWVEAWREKCASGDVIVVRYVDDTVMGFEQRADAERFLEDLGARLRKFSLELHPDETRLIEFGRHAVRSQSEATWREET